MKFISKILKLANNELTVPLSGGVDSLAVAHFIKTKCPKIKTKAMHFNHRLRPQNLEMEISCRKFCQEFSIPFLVKSRWEPDEDKHPEASDMTYSEATLRHLRYKAMEGLGYVVTAHHLGDACENHFFNFCNGVEQYLPIPVFTIYETGDLNIIRPFILNSKEDFRKYATENDLNRFVVEDETNKDNKYRRNWVRNEILPLIDKNYNLETIVRKKYIKYIMDNF